MRVSGKKAVRTKRGQSEDKVRTLLYDERIQSFIHTICPLAMPPVRAALRFAGPLRTVAKMSAKGISWNHPPTAANFQYKSIFVIVT